MIARKSGKHECRFAGCLMDWTDVLNDCKQYYKSRMRSQLSCVDYAHATEVVWVDACWSGRAD